MAQPVFRDLGGIFQLHIGSPEDLERIGGLDKARWAATSAPTGDFLCDPKFLEHVDSDSDGRIRLLDVRAAQTWLWERLQNRSRLMAGTEVLRLADLNPDHASTTQMVNLAVHLLKKLGAANTDEIALDQVRTFRAEYVKQFPNGDGVVTAPQAQGEAQAALVADIIAATGGTKDVSGEQGVAVADIDAWTELAAAFVAWRGRLDTEAEAINPLGDDTAAAAALITDLGPKLDQYFAQCALLALEDRAATALAATDEELAALDTDDPAAIQAWLAQAPVARPNADGVIDLDGPLNSHYAGSLRALAEDFGPRLLGLEGKLAALDTVTWQALQAAVQPHLDYAAAAPAGIPGDADPAALQALMDGPVPDELRALCAEDQGVAEELAAFNGLAKLILYQRWIIEFANNFVAFPHLFDDGSQALFQKGVLVMDGRKMRLAVRVADKASHKKLAEGSLMFLAYLDLVRKDGGAVRTDKVVAAVTSGTRGGIAVGKRGVFYSREGAEWDAIVTDLVVQPISLWEAIIAPFVRARDAVAARFKKMAESKAAAAEKDAMSGAEAAAKTPPPAEGAAPAADSGGNMQNLVIGGTVALSAGIAAIGFLVNTMASIDPMDLLLAVGVLILIVAAIFGFLGWLKLRKRDLSTLLEAGGWALNGRMRLSQYMAQRFTERPGLPKGAVRRRDTPMTLLQKVLLGLLLLVAAAAVTYAFAPELITGLLPS